MALTGDRRTPIRADKELHSFGVKGATKIWAGALVVLNAGFAVGGSTAIGLIAVGRAEHYVDNSAGANGDLQIKVRAGIFQFANSASTDLIAITEIGSDCYIVDDQTVAKTNGSNTRSVAGKVVGVDAQGVWVAIGPGNVI
jgi:hypothetical protein